MNRNSQLSKIEKLVAIGWFEKAAYYKGKYERRHNTFLKRHKFLNEYKDYVAGLGGLR